MRINRARKSQPEGGTYLAGFGGHGMSHLPVCAPPSPVPHAEHRLVSFNCQRSGRTSSFNRASALSSHSDCGFPRYIWSRTPFVCARFQIRTSVHVPTFKIPFFNGLSLGMGIVGTFSLKVCGMPIPCGVSFIGRGAHRQAVVRGSARCVRANSCICPHAGPQTTVPFSALFPASKPRARHASYVRLSPDAMAVLAEKYA